jgi:small subunit ribosomal protein S1
LDGRIEKVIKGGFEVRLGKVRGFCPQSQIDLFRPGDLESYVGRSLLFRVTQLRRGGEDVVVSRRVLLEEERAEEAKAVRATLVEGLVTQGHVAGLADFGAFVDLGAGVMGLVHVSELSHSRVSRVDAAVKVGDLVQVKLLKVDDASGRISLSLRQAQNDPWRGAAERFKVGQIVQGTPQRMTRFGAFVELAPGVEALAPASEFPPSATPWRDRLEPDKPCDWLILSMDAEKRRISLTPPVDGFDPAQLKSLAAGSAVKGKIQRIEKFGVFVWLGPGCVGLMPNMWTGTARGTDLHTRFPIGDDIEVQIVEVDLDARRIRVANKGVRIDATPVNSKPQARAPRRKTPRSPARPPSASVSDDGNGFGSLLADKLKAALGTEQR